MFGMLVAWVIILIAYMLFVFKQIDLGVMFTIQVLAIVIQLLISKK